MASVSSHIIFAKMTKNTSFTSRLLLCYLQNLVLAKLLAISKHPLFYNYSENHWYQHVLYKEIHYLTFIFLAKMIEILLDSNLTMLNILYSIINLSYDYYHNKQNFIYSLTQSSYHITYQTTLSVAWSHGIRAGP